MPARKRSEVPMEGVKHGPAGYKAGCGCLVCRASNAKGQERKRERDRGEDELSVRRAQNRKAEPTYGERETLIRRVITGYGDLSPEAEALASLAIMNARLIDRIQLDGKWHLLSVTVRTLRDCMKELKSLVNVPAPAPGPVGGDEGDDFAASLRQPGES